MKNYIVYSSNKEILRTGICQDSTFYLQAQDEFVMEGIANDSTQKIEFDGFDADGQPINPRVVDKIPEEIEADNPKPIEIPVEKQLALITNEQWQDILDRYKNLEKRSAKNDE